MQFCIIFYKGTVQYSILLLEFQFYNVHANRFTSKHSYFRITLLRPPIGKNLHSACFHKYPVSTCSAPCEETSFYLENYSSSTQTTYSLLIKPPGPSSWRIYSILQEETRATYCSIGTRILPLEVCI